MFARLALWAFASLVLSSSPLGAQTFTSFPTQLRTKVIYARAAGEVSKVNLRQGQVFLWDELAATIEPTQNVRPEFGRVNTDFAGAVSKVLVKAGDRVDKGAPLFECRMLENVYASCVVPASLNISEDQPIIASYDGETFEGKVLSKQTENGKTYVNVLIYNSHEEHYWHLTHGLKVAIKF